MRSLGFSVVYFLFSLAVLSLSLLFMLAPKVFREFVAWYSGADRWSSIKRKPPKESLISNRIAGFFMTLAALMMARFALMGLIHGGVVLYSPTRTPETAPSPFPRLIVGAALVGIGAFLVIRPDTVLRATERMFPDRTLSPLFVKRARFGGRIFGVLTILSGAFLLYLTHF